MAQYQPSYVDVSGFSKAISDAAYKAQQLALKQEDYMNRSIDNQFKMYSGKLRKNDAAKFDSYFAEYEQAQKQYQRLNRVGGRPDEIRKASELAAEKKSSMMNFVERSTAYGAYQMGLGKLYKDPNKLINRTKFNETYSSLDMYDADELDSMFGGIDKLPKDYDIRPEDVDMSAWLTTAQKASKVGNLSSNTIKRPKINPTTGQQETRDVSIEGYGTFKLPIIQYKIGLTAQESLAAVDVASMPGTKNAEAPTLAKKQLDDDLKSNNPAVVAAAKARLDRTMSMYNISDPSQVTGRFILAQDISSKSESTIELDDWSTFENIQQQMDRMEGRNMDKLRKKVMLKQLEEAGSDGVLKNAQKLATFLNTASSSGIIFEEQGRKWANDVIQSVNPGWTLSEEMINSMKAGKIYNAEEVAKMVLFRPKPTPVPNPKLKK